MLKIFKETILSKVHQLLKDELNLDNSFKWKKKGNNCFIPIVEDTQKSLYAYFGIRFIPNRDYVIPYLRVSSSELKIVNDDYIMGINIFDKIERPLDITIDKCSFDDYLNTTVEILQQPPNNIIDRLKIEDYNQKSLDMFGITNLELSSQNIRSWDMFTEFFNETDINSDEISMVISPLIQDIQRILFDYFIPFIKKIEIS